MAQIRRVISTKSLTNKILIKQSSYFKTRYFISQCRRALIHKFHVVINGLHNDSDDGQPWLHSTTQTPSVL